MEAELEFGLYGAVGGKPEIGTDIGPVAEYMDIMRHDEVLPPPFADRGNYTPEQTPVPFAWFTDPKYAALEMEHIWKKCWQIAGREEDIPNFGDRMAYDVGTLSYIIVRTGADSFKAFYNSCRHRGLKLCEGISSGEHFQCPFHGWTWGLEGDLIWVPTASDFPHVTPENRKLDEVRLERWGGNIFINPDPEAPALAAALGPIADHFREVPQEERYTIGWVHKKIRANWKIAQDAFQEAYHEVETHWDAMAYLAGSHTRYDVWDDEHSQVSRILTPLAAADAFVAGKVDAEASVRAYCEAFMIPQPPEGGFADSGEARRYAAKARCEAIKADTGHDLSGQPVGYILDAMKYFMFPNFHPWGGEGTAWWYRFLPYGDNPNECTMEVRVTKLLPKDGPRPASAQRVDLDFDDWARDNPDTAWQGYILDQDVSNLVRIQKGLYAAMPGHDRMTFAREQEKNVQSFYNRYQRLLGIEGE
jgi:phenylpropionate dioxygenase-like ring-hydroxylating dioxygenase large terminal subunit